MSARRFIIGSFLLCAILLVLMGIFNLAMNPYGEFSWSIVPPARAPLRIIKMEVIKNFKSGPIESVVLGSSRMQEVDPQVVVPGTTGINLSLYNPTMEDVYAIWKFLLRIRGAPDYVILGLEINMFKPGLMDNASLYAIPQLASYVPWTRWDKVRYEFMRFRRLFRVYTTVRSVTLLEKVLAGKKPLVRFDERGLPHIPGLPFSQEIEPLKKPPRRVLKKRDKQRKQLLVWFREIKYRNFDKIGEMKKKLFEGILADCRNNGIWTMVFITPMHPDMVELTRAMTPYEEWLDYVKKTSEKYGAVYVDFGDSSRLPFIPDWAFVDNAHLSHDAVLVIDEKLRELFQKIPAAKRHTPN